MRGLGLGRQLWNAARQRPALLARPRAAAHGLVRFAVLICILSLTLGELGRPGHVATRFQELAELRDAYAG